MRAPQEEFEKHLYALLRALPESVTREVLPLSSSKMSSLLKYAKEGGARRPINKADLVPLREKLLKHLEEKEDDPLHLAVDYPC